MFGRVITGSEYVQLRAEATAYVAGREGCPVSFSALRLIPAPRWAAAVVDGLVEGHGVARDRPNDSSVHGARIRVVRTTVITFIGKDPRRVFYWLGKGVVRVELGGVGIQHCDK